MSKEIHIVNWNKYQHYQHRDPPWIKLHIKTFNDREFMLLSCASRGLLMQLWLLASENKGKLPYVLEDIRFRLRDNTITDNDLEFLADKGFIKIVEVNDSTLLASASSCAKGESNNSVSVINSVINSEEELESYNSLSDVPKEETTEEALLLDAFCFSVGRDSILLTRDEREKHLSAIREYLPKGKDWCMKAIEHNRKQSGTELAITARSCFWKYADGNGKPKLKSGDPSQLGPCSVCGGPGTLTLNTSPPRRICGTCLTKERAQHGQKDM